MAHGSRWYDLFSNVYDAWLERLYRPWREQAFSDLALPDGHAAVDLCCGTGQNLPFLAERLGGAPVVGVDRSPGMLRRAGVRVGEAGWEHVHLLEHDVQRLTLEDVHAALDEERPVGLVVIALGLTVLPEWEQALAAALSLLAPGGQLLIFDAHAERRSFQTWSVELLAQADLNRKVWEPLQAKSDGFALRWLGAPQGTFGGDLLVATGRRPAD